MTTFNKKSTETNSLKATIERFLVLLLHPDVIDAISPLFLASIGTILGIVVLIHLNVGPKKATAGLSLAGTAMAGAAGLARSGRSGQDFSVKQQDGNLEVETPADH